jgi:hypothetical protein
MTFFHISYDLLVSYGRRALDHVFEIIDPTSIGQVHLAKSMRATIMLQLLQWPLFADDLQQMIAQHP